MRTYDTNKNININDCDFRNNVISGSSAWFTNARQPVVITSTNFRGDVDLLAMCNINDLLTHSVVNNGIQLENVRSLILSNTNIQNCNMGVNGVSNAVHSDAVNFFHNNLTLFNRTAIENNFIGIWTNGGINEPTFELNELIDYGSVLLDCVTLENNEIGIKGTDILLQIDALENCGNCELLSENHRPNTFIRGTGELYFDICLDQRAGTYNDGEVRARGNYWDIAPIAAAASPVYVLKENCNTPGQDNIQIEYLPEVLNRPVGCNPFAETPDDPNDPQDNECEMLVTPGGGEEVVIYLPERLKSGIDKIYVGNLPGAMIELSDPANISNLQRAAAAAECRTKIDFARTYVPRADEIIYSPLVIDHDSDTANPENRFDILVSPNPGRGHFHIETKGGEFSLHVLDVFGKSITDTNFTDNYDLNLRNFTDGIYFAHIKNTTTGDAGTTIKLIKQSR